MPSIAASVATMDGQRFKYSSELRAQRNTRGGSQEIVIELEQMMLGHLRRWVGVPPPVLLVFRDGVSQGQYAAAVEKEVHAIRKACQSFRAGYAPKVTYIVCSKRHHIRFFAENPQDNDQRSASLPSGTVVDQVATHPFAFDWYGQSHGG
jgi:eukaryotic translation initiation factor 2C